MNQWEGWWFVLVHHWGVIIASTKIMWGLKLETDYMYKGLQLLQCKNNL